MTDEGWSVVFNVGFTSVVAIASYFSVYYALGWLGISSIHQVAISIIVSFCVAIALQPAIGIVNKLTNARSAFLRDLDQGDK